MGGSVYLANDTLLQANIFPLELMADAWDTLLGLLGTGESAGGGGGGGGAGYRSRMS